MQYFETVCIIMRSYVKWFQQNIPTSTAFLVKRDGKKMAIISQEI